MDFTREPIIETVITPKDGCTLAVRSSKGTGQEEYFVDAVEVVSFGNALFFRSLERPKNFMLPVSDYEILEVRETRLVLKNVGLDRSIKIAGGREASLRTAKPQEKAEPVHAPVEASQSQTPKPEQPESPDAKQEVKLDKKRDRRRNYKRKKGREEQQEGETGQTENGEEPVDKKDVKTHAPSAELTGENAAIGVALPAVFSSLLPPPSTLISETIARYKDNALFRGAFFVKEGEATSESHSHGPTENLEIDHPQLETPHDDDVIELPSISLDLPAYVPPEVSEEEHEKIYQERKGLRLKQSNRKLKNDVEREDFESSESEPSNDEMVEIDKEDLSKDFEDDFDAPDEHIVHHGAREEEHAHSHHADSALTENMHAEEFSATDLIPDEANEDLHHDNQDLFHKKSSADNSSDDYFEKHPDLP